MVVPPNGGLPVTASRMGGPSVQRGKLAPINGPISATIPLSARHADPLDLNTVERRCKPVPGVREPPTRTHINNIPEAPTYKPTDEEWKNPMEYMRKIGPEGSKYGIIKIIPPDNWNPELALDTSLFHFRTRKQELNSVEGGTRANLNYLDQLSKFHKSHGMNLSRFPSVDKKPLDLYELKKAVASRGGFERVCKHKKWAEIGRDLGYSGKIMSSLSTSLKNSYAKWLDPYERFLRGAKPSVQMQLEQERGGPYGTPSPGPSPVRRPDHYTPSLLGPDSPAIRASQALNDNMKDHSDTVGRSTESSCQGPAAGFTAANGGGFIAANASRSGITSTPTSTPNGARQERSETPCVQVKKSPFPSAGMSSSGYAPHAGYAPLDDRKRRGPSEGNDETDKDTEESERRSKRIKKEPSAPTVIGSHMLQHRTGGPRSHAARDRTNEKPGDICEACGKGHDDEKILICEGCYDGYHTYCLDPPLDAVPDNDWHCKKCLVGTGEFGFEEGGTYSLKQFQEKAFYFKDNHFAGKMPFDPILNGPKPVGEDDVEREFWRLVSSITETVEVEYGADVHSTTHGSGFPTHELQQKDPYSFDPWNLTVLPLIQDSLFRYIKTDISGMTVPWLYVGMCFSTFCWHNEDHYTYSANYQHFGATKTWYGIPGADAARFEDAMRAAVPDLFESQPDLLFQLVTLLEPESLKKAGVNVYAVDQRAGQMVITFPQAYHAGFNHGFNLNEAVNFAPADWEPFGRAGMERLRDFRRQPCFSHDELLLTAAASKDMNIKTAKWLAPALQDVLNKEKVNREVFEARVSGGQYLKTAVEGEEPARIQFGRITDNQDLPEEETICSYCNAYSYLSRFTCEKTKKIACLDHIDAVDCCDDQEGHVLHWRMTIAKLEQVVNKITDKARVPEAWIEKFESTIGDTPTPALKVLRTLLSEGERIPWDIPQLVDLKGFVDRCNEWVEEAMGYITRKQQNRRKSEKASRKGSIAKQSELEEREREIRKLDNIKRLLASADQIGFECPEITTLQERANAIETFQRDARKALSSLLTQKTQDIEDLIEVGKSYLVDIPEVEHLEKVVSQMKWTDKASVRGQSRTLQDVEELLEQATEINVPDWNEHLRYLKDQKQKGEEWEAKARELMGVENVQFAQLDAFSKQAADLPVSKETLASIDAILKKQREAQDQVHSIYDRSKDPDFTERPFYKEVRELMEAIVELNSKPVGTLDLEKEQKRHEDWMRRGKRLFGKSNAPLHILLQHMEIVEARNRACFDLTDRPRTPVEPSSRENTPEQLAEGQPGASNRDIFCLCRTPEAGLMIECHVCHEWYHSKCLKIARGKVKEDEDFCCPVCDYRVKIPRDAARPKLEDLINWQAEIPQLPFQPDEEACLDSIINMAQAFRDAMVHYTSPHPLVNTLEEVPTQRFWLRKIEGADILLAHETNFFRQELHRLVPIAPQAPPILEASLSTRKPRPTKQQKMMAILGIENPDDLPQHLKTKPYNVNKRKAQDDAKSQHQGRPSLKTSGSSGSGSTPSLAANNSMGLRGQQTSQPPQGVHQAQQNINFHPPLTAGAFPPSIPHHHSSQPDSPLFSTAPSNLHISAAISGIPSLESPFISGALRDPPMPRAGMLDPSLFSPGIGIDSFNEHHDRLDVVDHPPLDHDVEDAHDDGQVELFGNGGSSQSGGNFDSMFADLTNEDEAGDGPVGVEAQERAEGETDGLDPVHLFTNVE